MRHAVPLVPANSAPCKSNPVHPYPQELVKDTLARDNIPRVPSAPSFPLKRFLSPWAVPLVFFPARVSDNTTTGPEPSEDVLVSALRRALGELARSGGEAPIGRNFNWVEAESTYRDEDSEPVYTVAVTALCNVWSRKARRAAAAAAPPLEAPSRRTLEPGRASDPHDDPAGRRAPMLELRIELWSSTSSREEDLVERGGRAVRLEGWWIRGSDRDRSALEGLWSFLTRRIGDELRGGKAADGEAGGASEARERGDGGGGRGGEMGDDGGNDETLEGQRKKRKL